MWVTPGWLPSKEGTERGEKDDTGAPSTVEVGGGGGPEGKILEMESTRLDGTGSSGVPRH